MLKQARKDTGHVQTHAQGTQTHRAWKHTQGTQTHTGHVLTPAGDEEPCAARSSTAYTLPPACATPLSCARDATNMAVFRAPRKVPPLAAAAAAAAASLAAVGGRLAEAEAERAAAAAASSGVVSAGRVEGW